MRTSVIRLLTAAAIVAVAAPAAHADSFFWAINQFVDINKLNGDTGAIVDSFAVPGRTGLGASVAIVGNTAYYTQLGDTNVYKYDVTTHAFGGTAFTIANDPGINGITVDSGGHLWFAGGSGAPLREYSTAGVLLSTHAFPTPANAYRDGSVVFGNFVVANRGDQQGPYDKYNLSGGNTPLTYNTQPFINAGFGSNGIAFNGVNFYTSDEQAHKVSKWDINGNFVSIANLDPGSRYENWTFASQDIVPPPPVAEPLSLALLGMGVLGIAVRRRRG